ncbi:hypothetical protein HAX54_011247 [Datura stramonium]|uniref:Uncharacterized protein n=1 Tax=Datura stramonium TaxID=4076 RepID=A0ABS8THK7_DATST|nr:hypothetical protein [Datura stramonium]
MGYIVVELLELRIHSLGVWAKSGKKVGREMSKRGSLRPKMKSIEDDLKKSLAGISQNEEVQMPLLILLIQFVPVISFCHYMMPIRGEDNNTSAAKVDVGIILDLETDVGKVMHISILLALADHHDNASPRIAIRIVPHLKDSKKDDVEAASAAIYLLKDVQSRKIPTSSEEHFLLPARQRPLQQLLRTMAGGRPEISSCAQPFLGSRLFLKAKEAGDDDDGYAWIITDVLWSSGLSRFFMIESSMQVLTKALEKVGGTAISKFKKAAIRKNLTDLDALVTSELGSLLTDFMQNTTLKTDSPTSPDYDNLVYKVTSKDYDAVVGDVTILARGGPKTSSTSTAGSILWSVRLTRLLALDLCFQRSPLVPDVSRAVLKVTGGESS